MGKESVPANFTKPKSTRCTRLGFFLAFQLTLGLLAIWYLVSTESSILIQKPIFLKKPWQFPPSTTGANKTQCQIGAPINSSTGFQVLYNLTSAIQSCYHVVTPLDQLIRGSIIHVIIEARDELQQPMTSGDDFWYATMSTNHPFQASTAGRVVDHHNGTYSVYFYAAWSGEAEINITLVNPSKAVRFLHNTMWNIGPKVFWDARFQNMTTPFLKNNSFDTVCWVEATDDVGPSKCTYPAPNALGDYTFVCNPPTIDGVCRSLDIIAEYVKKTLKYTDRAAGDNTKYFQRRYYKRRLLRGPKHIFIADRPTNATVVAAASRAPVMNHTQDHSPLRLLSHGYWMNRRWNSFLYKNHWTNVSDIRDCLRNKHMLLLGDSTTRQWAENIGLPDLLDLVNGIYREEHPKLFFENEYPEFNLTVTFRFHPQTITEKRVQFRLYRYFVDILDSLPTDECANTIVVLSPWAHFVQWTRDSYTQRLVKLKEAVDRLKQRCPATPIIIKGCHLREHNSDTAKWGWSDYILQEMNKLMRHVFAESETWFLDVWDMNLAYLSKKFIHMPTVVVQEELKLALSYVCQI